MFLWLYSHLPLCICGHVPLKVFRLLIIMHMCIHKIMEVYKMEYTCISMHKVKYIDFDEKLDVKEFTMFDPVDKIDVKGN